MMRMQGKVVLVTGGAAGIGRATARRFAQEVAKVAICDLNEVAGQATVDELLALGADAAYHKANVAEQAAVRTWVAEVIARYGRIDELVNDAGIVRDGQLVKFKKGELSGQMAEADFAWFGRRWAGGGHIGAGNRSEAEEAESLASFVC